MGDNPNVALIKKRSTVIKHKRNNSKKSKTLNRNEKNGRGRVGWAIPGTLGNATVAAQEGEVQGCSSHVAKCGRKVKQEREKVRARAAPSLTGHDRKSF